MLVIALAGIAALAVAALVAQLAIPRIAAARIGRRLTEGGGNAEVWVRAVPATRLLRNGGDSLEVRGRGLVIGLAGGGPGAPSGLSALDGFDQVDIELVDFRTGPFSIDAFVLARTGRDTYAMATRGRTSGTELMRLGEGLIAGLPGSALLAAVAGTLPAPLSGSLGGREVTLSVEIELISEGGRLRVGSGGGTIAGYPAGPIATAIAAAVARRLEIAP